MKPQLVALQVAHRGGSAVRTSEVDVPADRAKVEVGTARQDVAGERGVARGVEAEVAAVLVLARRLLQHVHVGRIEWRDVVLPDNSHSASTGSRSSVLHVLGVSTRSV